MNNGRFDPAVIAQQKASRAARLARRNANAPPAAPPAAAVAVAAAVAALPAPAPPAPAPQVQAQLGGPPAAAPAPAPAQGAAQQTPQGQAQPVGAAPAQHAQQSQAQPGGAPAVAAAQAPPAPAPAPAPAQAAAPHAKYLPAARRIIQWKKLHKGQLKRAPPLLPSELVTLFATLIDELHTRGEWEKHDGHANNTTDGVGTTLGLLKSDFHGASNPHRQNGKAKRARKMENKQKRLPAQDQVALSKAESVVAELILLLDTAVAVQQAAPGPAPGPAPGVAPGAAPGVVGAAGAAQQVPQAQVQQAQAQPGAPALAPAYPHSSAVAAIGAVAADIVVKWRSMPAPGDATGPLQALVPLAMPPAEPQPAVVTPDLRARYDALTDNQRKRRKIAILFGKYYKPGHQDAFYSHYADKHVAEVATITIPKPGPWPGLSTSLSRTRWRASVKNRRYVSTKKNVLIPPRIGGVDENGEHYPAGDPRNATVPANVRMTDHNIAAMKKPGLPRPSIVAGLNILTRDLRMTGLRQLRPLGIGGFGFTGLFRVRRVSSRRRKALFFVVKGLLDTSTGSFWQERDHLRVSTPTTNFIGVFYPSLPSFFRTSSKS